MFSRADFSDLIIGGSGSLALLPLLPSCPDPDAEDSRIEDQQRDQADDVDPGIGRAGFGSGFVETGLARVFRHL